MKSMKWLFLSTLFAANVAIAGYFEPYNNGLAAITCCSINGTTIGATTPSSGKFTTLEASGRIMSTGIGNVPAVTSTSVRNEGVVMVDSTRSSGNRVQMFDWGGGAFRGAFTDDNGAAYTDWLNVAGGHGAGVTSITLNSTNHYRGSKIIMSQTAPTIGGGFGTGASVTMHNGTAAFRVDVGTTPGNSGTIGLPSATNGWNCSVVKSMVADQVTTCISATVNSVGCTNRTVSAGVLANWADNAVLHITCVGM